MKNRFWGRIAVAAAAVTALSTAAVDNALAAPPPAPAGYNNQVDPARGTGSDTTFFMMQQIADLYNGSPGCKVPSAAGVDQTVCADDQTGAITTENYDHDEVQNAAPFGIGSGNGIATLCGTRPSRLPVQFARSSRDFQTGDCTGTVFHGFSRDGIAMLIFPTINTATQGSPAAGCKPGEKPVSAGGTGCTGFYSSGGNRRFTTQNIKDIFNTGTVTDWCQLNNGAATASPNPLSNPPTYFPTCATPQPIQLWKVNTGSGTYRTFFNYIGADPNGHATLPATGVLQENDARPIAAAGADVQQRSIFWGSSGRYAAAPFTKANGLTPSLDGVNPTVPNVANNTYPIRRLLYNVTKNSNDATPEGMAANAFLKWICQASHATNDETGQSFDVDLKKVFDKFFFVRLGPSTPNGNCIDDPH